MAKLQVTRTMLERRAIQAPNAEEAERLMSNYGPNQVETTATDVTAERAADDTPLPKDEEPAVKHYLLIVWHDVEPALERPFGTDTDRLERAREIRHESDEHGVYRLDADGGAVVGTFSGGEIGGD